MKEEYIRQVRRRLAVAPQQRREILRDLEEAFASAAEHGQTEQQVIDRLGSPRDFARSIHAQLGGEALGRRRARQRWLAALCLAIAAGAWGVLAIARARQLPDNVIGQADAMTSILVAGPSAVPAVLLLAGAAAAIAAVVAIRRLQQLK